MSTESAPTRDHAHEHVFGQVPHVIAFLDQREIRPAIGQGVDVAAGGSTAAADTQLESAAVAEQDVVAFAAVDLVRAAKADDDIAVAAADQDVRPGGAHQDVGAPAAHQRVARAGVEQQVLDVVDAALLEIDDVGEPPKRAGLEQDHSAAADQQIAAQSGNAPPWTSSGAAAAEQDVGMPLRRRWCPTPSVGRTLPVAESVPISPSSPNTRSSPAPDLMIVVAHAAENQIGAGASIDQVVARAGLDGREFSGDATGRGVIDQRISVGAPQELIVAHTKVDLEQHVVFGKARQIDDVVALTAVDDDLAALLDLIIQECRGVVAEGIAAVNRRP